MTTHTRRNRRRAATRPLWLWALVGFAIGFGGSMMALPAGRVVVAVVIAATAGVVAAPHRRRRRRLDRQHAAVAAQNPLRPA